jgi:hypothetical protein
MDVTTDETRIYWTDWFRGHVFSAAKSGGPRESLASSQRFAFRSPIVVDETYVYWTAEDPDKGMMSGAILRKHKRDDGPVEVLLGDLKPIGWLRDDASHLYATVPLVGVVLRVAKDGSDVDVLADQEEQPLGLALTEEHVYWCSQTDGSLKRCVKGGDGIEVIAEELEAPVALAADDTSVWVASKSDDGAIIRVDLGSGEASVFVGDQQRPTHLAHDETHVYWTTVGGVWRATKASGRLDRLAGFGRVYDPDNPQMLEHAPMGITVDDDSVYWVDIGEVGGLYGGPKNGVRHLT